MSRTTFFGNSPRRTRLAQSLSRMCQARINMIRKTAGSEALTNEDLYVSLETAVSLGYFRVLINRFSDAYGLTAQWWNDKRKLHARDTKDRRDDFLILPKYYPEFGTFERDDITDSEVLEAAKAELFDLEASPGTVHHDAYMQRYKNKGKCNDAIIFRPDVELVQVNGAQQSFAPSSSWEWAALDLSAQDRVENAFIYDMLDDERNIFGPGLSRVVALAIQHFGRGGLFWVAEWLFFPGRYTELMRVIGLDEYALGTTKFEAVKRDLVRKLPETHRDMMALLKVDPVLLAIKEILWGDDFLVTLPPPNPLPAPSPLLQTERGAFWDRMRTRLTDYVATDPELARATDVIQNDDGALLELFVQAQDHTKKLASFKREVLRRADPSASKAA